MSQPVTVITRLDAEFARIRGKDPAERTDQEKRIAQLFEQIAAEGLDRTGTCLRMDGRQVYNFAVKAIAERIIRSL